MQCLLQRVEHQKLKQHLTLSLLFVEGICLFSQPFLKDCLFSLFNKTLTMNQSCKLHKLLSFVLCLGCREGQMAGQTDFVEALLFNSHLMKGE